MRAVLAIADGEACDPERWGAVLKDAVVAGFTAVEVPAGALPERISQAREHGVRVGVFRSSCSTGAVRIGSADDGQRAQSIEQVAAELSGAAAVPGAVVTVAPARCTPGEGATPYSEALRATVASLRALAEEAACCGVSLGVEAATDGFLLSPAECYELVDLVNKPEVTVCLDLGESEVIAWPADWVRTLGFRLGCLRVGNLADVNVDELAAALRDVGYDGPVVLSGTASEAANLRDRLKSLGPTFMPGQVLRER